MSYFRNKDVARKQLGLEVFDAASVADPGADRIMFWDDSAGNVTWLAPSTHIEISGTDLRVTSAARAAALFYVIDGGGAVITTGVKGDLLVPFACTITAATLLADQSGSIVIDVWSDAYGSYPPTDADSITAAAPPTLTAAAKSQNTTLTGWTTSIAAGSTLRFNVDSVSTVTRVTLALSVTRT